MSALLGLASAVLCGLALSSDELGDSDAHKLVGAALGMVSLSTFLILFLIVTRYERLKAVDRPKLGGADAC